MSKKTYKNDWSITFHDSFNSLEVGKPEEDGETYFQIANRHINGTEEIIFLSFSQVNELIEQLEKWKEEIGKDLWAR